MRRTLIIVFAGLLGVGCGSSRPLYGGDASTGTDATTSDDGSTSNNDGALQPDADVNPGCVPENTRPCDCAGNPTGTETCQSDGTWGDCVCPPPCTPVGHDEDADGADDACDNCPTWANGGQADADADGVGDACEAPGDPGMLSDLPYFESWTAPPTADWIVGGGYQHAPDVLDCDVGGAVSNATYTTNLSQPFGAEAVFSFGDTWGNGWAGVRFGVTSDTSPWWACLLRREPTTGGSTTHLELWNYNGGGGGVTFIDSIDDVEPSGAEAPLWRRVRALYDGQTIRCQFANENGESQLLDHQPDPGLSSPNGRAGYRVYDDWAIFRSFVVYQ